MHIIYKHTCLTNGKIYIGQTQTKLDADAGMLRRWHGHVYVAKRNPRCHFHLAICKYGETQFTHEVLATCDSQREANDAEAEWILRLKSFDPNVGYNMTFGGEGVLLTPEHRERQRQATKDAMWRPEVRERHLAAQANPNTRLLHSVASKRSWQDAQTRNNHRKGWENSKKVKRYAVQQCTRESGQIIATYPSVCEASRQTHVHKSSIFNHLAGNQSHAGGFTWKYCDNDAAQVYNVTSEKEQ